MAIPPCPESLKAVAHYLKIAEEHDSRDIVISYWCRIYALEVAMKLSTDTKTPEINKFLLSVMDWLENTKLQNTNNDGITSKICAQATIENHALKLFKYADEQDRAENYGKNVVKAFYTAGILMDVLTSFDDLTDDIAEKRKYAKWKAAYIHNCLKAGERPIPGPTGSDEDDFTPVSKDTDRLPTDFTIDNTNMLPDPPMNKSNISGPPTWPTFPAPPLIPTTPYVQPTPTIPSPTQPVATIPSVGIQISSVNLDPEQIQKAQKYCKWASSALNYDDVKSAIDSLQKALILLQTGKDSSE